MNSALSRFVEANWSLVIDAEVKPIEAFPSTIHFRFGINEDDDVLKNFFSIFKQDF